MELRHSNSIFKFRMKISYFSIDSKLLGSYFRKTKKKKVKYLKCAEWTNISSYIIYGETMFVSSTKICRINAALTTCDAN